MASSLSFRDPHGWQSLELSSHKTSPFIKSHDHDIHHPGQAPIQRDPRQLSTAFELMKHPIAGEKAPRGTVQIEKHHQSRRVTRLTNPMQLHSKLSVHRKRGQTPNPSLPSPRDAEKSELDESAAETPPVEASTTGLWAFEKNAGGFAELEGKQLLQINGFEDSDLRSELPGQSMDSDLDHFAQVFAMDAMRELNTPYSALVPSPWSSSTTSRQRTSGTWSAISQLSTLFDQSLRASPQYSKSMEHIPQQPTMNKGSWISPGSLLGSAFSPDGSTLLAEMSSTSPPEELTSNPGSQGPWYSGYPLNSQQGIIQSTHANAIEYSHYAEGDFDQVEGTVQAPSWQNPALLSLQYYPKPTAVSSHFISPTSSAPISEQIQLVDQPISDTSPMVSERDYSTIIEDNPAVIAAYSLSARGSHTRASWPGTGGSMAEPVSRSNRAKSARQKPRIDAVADIKYGTLQCQFAGCNHQSTGLRKNLRGHLARHMNTHSTEKMLCPYPGCKRFFPLDRSDNLSKHINTVHLNKR